MSHQLFIGLIAEGTTDYRFLKPIIEKTFIDVAFDCKGQIDIDVKIIECDNSGSFSDYVLKASQVGHQDFGITMLIVHSDADDSSSVNTYKNKITPAKSLLEQQSDETHCKNLIPIVPIYETESWMLADKDEIIKSIGSKKDENELKINGNPETFTNPKERIEDAIRIGRADMPKKLQKSLDISGLYSYLGQSISIEKLKTYKSYIDFEKNIRSEFIKLNLLQK